MFVKNQDSFMLSSHSVPNEKFVHFWKTENFKFDQWNFYFPNLVGRIRNVKTPIKSTKGAVQANRKKNKFPRNKKTIFGANSSEFWIRALLGFFQENLGKPSRQVPSNNDEFCKFDLIKPLLYDKLPGFDKCYRYLRLAKL